MQIQGVGEIESRLGIVSFHACVIYLGMLMFGQVNKAGGHWPLILAKTVPEFCLISLSSRRRRSSSFRRRRSSSSFREEEEEEDLLLPEIFSF